MNAYDKRVRELEAEGLTTSDAQGAADVEFSRIKHTPGPCYHSKVGNAADQWMIVDNTGRTIGLSYHGEANARLWAASDEMLATLKFYADRETGDAVDFGDRARATIANATGHN